jgi:hypothetical protein
MNAERLFEYVMMDMSKNKIRLEDELEKVINSEEPVDVKSTKIIGILTQLNNLESNVSKFTSMLSINKNNNEE